MFFYFFHGLLRESDTETISQSVLLAADTISNSPDIWSGIGRFHTVDFSRATNGYVYMATGLDEMVKWDGIKRQISTVGITAPATELDLEGTGAGSLTGTYRAYVRFVDEDGNVSSLSPASDIVEIEDASTIVYTNVPTSTEDKVVSRQILRNTSGQFLTYYVDVSTDDLSADTFSSTKTDAQLRTGSAAVPLFTDDLVTFLGNQNNLPPNDKPFLAFHNNFMFAYGELAYTDGNIQVTHGSTTVTGIGTEWSEALEGRFLYVTGADRGYEIDSVDTANQTLTLTAIYRSATDLFASYRIRPAPSRRHILSHSVAGGYDGWPATQEIEVASSDDIDDQGTGLVSTHSFLYILQQRHIYRFSFLDDPAIDGGIFLSARRGCVNNRCWVNVDGWMYCLDDRGIYRFDGSENTEDLSQPVQDLFYWDDGDFRINWASARYFHASHDRTEATLRWFVSFSGQSRPRHAICYNYSTPQWWVEEYPFAIGASCLLKNVASIPICAGKYRKVYALGIGPLDVMDPDEGDTRGLATDSSQRSVTVETATVLPTASLIAGSPVGIVEGRGKGQWRRIVSVSGQRLNVMPPWSVVPDTTSVIQVGAIPWRWKSGWMDYPPSEFNQPRRVTVGFKPTTSEQKVDLRIYADYSGDPLNWALDWPRVSGDTSHVEYENESPDAELDLRQPKGFVRQTLDSFSSYDEFKPDNVAVELRGFSCAEKTEFYRVSVDGAVARREG